MRPTTTLPATTLILPLDATAILQYINQRLKPQLFIIPVALLLLTAALALWWRNGRLERSQDQPIHEAARRYSVDPALIKAVVWRESRFNPTAQGRAQEIGLMQIRELAAQEWADAEHLETFVHEHCFDPFTNTLAGTWYLKKLLNRYQKTDNPIPYALADYNAGRGNVLKWLNGEATTNSASFIEQIGFPGTKNYVKEVMHRSERYGIRYAFKQSGMN